MVESQEAEINTSIGLINTSACMLFVLEEKKLTVLGRPNDTLNSIVVLAQHLDKTSVKIPPFPTRKSAFFELLNQKTSKSLGGSASPSNPFIQSSRESYIGCRPETSGQNGCRVGEAMLNCQLDDACLASSWWTHILGGWGGPDRSWSCIVYMALRYKLSEWNGMGIWGRTPSHDETKRRDESGEKATEEMPSTGGWSTWSG